MLEFKLQGGRPPRALRCAVNVGARDFRRQFGSRANVAGDHAARTNHGPVTDRHAGEQDCSATDPDVTTDVNGTAEFEACCPCCGFPRVISRQDLDSRSDCVLSPMKTATTSRTTQSKSRKTSAPSTMLNP